MEGCMRYNVVAILSHWKLDKMKTHQKKKARQAAVYIVCYDNGMQHPKRFSQLLIWWKKCKSSLASGFPGPFGKEKRPGRLLITKKIEEKFTRYLQEIYWHEMKVHTDESSFQDITDAMMEKLKKEGESRYSIDLR